ncbi:hypothetical protein C4577_07945 [Candidatus Parcubacteria bacterium]|nr:MAG: hypothetical protein C4577_07945 [Candidatus Parcubacteria bacterium]
MFNILEFNKRQKLVLLVVFLTISLFFSQLLPLKSSIVWGVILAFLTDLFLYVILRKDVRGSFFYPILILPFFYTIAFSLFYMLFPERFLSRFIISGVYAFGLYSLLLTQNIFAISSIRTINLLRSARIVSFVITILVLLFLINIIFSFNPPFYMITVLIFAISFLLNVQSFWSYTLSSQNLKEIVVYSASISLALSELSIVLTIWPVNPTIYSIFLTGMFYVFSGLSHNWFEKRLFKGILWEYVWVAFISILLLVVFSKWGI